MNLIIVQIRNKPTNKKQAYMYVKNFMHNLFPTNSSLLSFWRNKQTEKSQALP